MMSRVSWITPQARRTAIVLGLGGALSAGFISAPVQASERPNDRIVFSQEADGKNQGDILTIAPDGSHMETLLGGIENDSSPRWSPDRKRIAFVRSQHHSSRLYVMNSDATRLRPITPSYLDVGAATWAPDGKELTFDASIGRFNSDIYTIGIDGKGLQRMTDWDMTEMQPSWSPNGESILFLRYTDPVCSIGSPCGGELYTINPKTRELKRITQSQQDEYGATWSPDGSLIAYSAFECVSVGAGCTVGSDLEIYVITPDGSGKRQVTDNSEDDLYPSFSPDGSWIVFSDRDSSRGWPYRGDLMKVPSDGDYKIPIVVENSPDEPITETLADESSPDW